MVEHVVVDVIGVVDSTGSQGTMMVLLTKMDMLEVTDALRKEMERGVVGLWVDTVAVVVDVESRVTSYAHVGTLTARVEQLTGKQSKAS